MKKQKDMDLFLFSVPKELIQIVHIKLEII